MISGVIVKLLLLGYGEGASMCTLYCTIGVANINKEGEGT